MPDTYQDLIEAYKKASSELAMSAFAKEIELIKFFESLGTKFNWAVKDCSVKEPKDRFSKRKGKVVTPPEHYTFQLDLWSPDGNQRYETKTRTVSHTTLLNDLHLKISKLQVEHPELRLDG